MEEIILGLFELLTWRFFEAFLLQWPHAAPPVLPLVCLEALLFLAEGCTFHLTIEKFSKIFFFEAMPIAESPELVEGSTVNGSPILQSSGFPPCGPATTPCGFRPSPSGTPPAPSGSAPAPLIQGAGPILHNWALLRVHLGSPDGEGKASR